MKREIILRGIPTSPGIAIGKTMFFSQKSLKPELQEISPDQIESEIDRFDSALIKTRADMDKTRSKATKEMGEIVGRIFDSHLLILEDALLIEEVMDKIQKERFSADYALYLVMSKTYNSLLSQRKDYFRERADDVRDVGTRLLFNLSGRTEHFEFTSGEPAILAARIISPSEIVHIDRKLLLGVMTDMGGVTSHTAILTRALEVPAVVALKKVSSYAEKVDISVINGNSGKVILNPTPAHQSTYRAKQERYLQFYTNLANLKELPAETLDHHKVKLMANIEFPSEARTADEHGADGIGLFRTEYLFLMNNQFPSEEEQFEAYSEIVKRMKRRPVTIRTFDLGGDKAPLELEIGREANPFMGLRAVRVSLARPELFKIQLRAILRASAFGCVNLMFPLVTGIAELREIKKILSEVKNELISEKIPFDQNLKVGIMIEVPSAVMMAPELAREADFFSLGTNDLIQFTLAVDRGNEMVADLFQDLHPALLRMIKMTIDAGKKQGIEVGMCGEMAGDPIATVILLGLGLDQFSVSPLMLPEIKKIVRSISFADAQLFAQEMLTKKTYKDIFTHSVKMMKRRFADLPIWFSKNEGR